MRVQSLGLKDPLEEETATHASIFAWKIPWTGAWWATVHGVTKSQTQLSDPAHTHTHTHMQWLNCCFCSVAKSCLTLCDSVDSSTPGFPALHHLPELAQTQVHWVSDAIQPSHSLSSPSPLAFNLSRHQGFFQRVNSSHHVAKVLELQHQSFRVDFLLDWLVLAVQGTLKCLLQHHNSKASILQCSAFFKIQLLHLYLTTRKTIALTRQTFVSVVMSLLFNTLSKSSPKAQVLKNPPAMQKTPVWFLGPEDLLQNGWATHSSILGLRLWLSL